MIDGADLAMFERSLRHATASHSGAALDAALAELGWHDALADDRRAAVSLLFTLQGTANVTSAALDEVITATLLHRLPPGPPGGGDAAVVLPAVGQWRAPGTLADGRLHLDGVATRRLRERETCLVVVRGGESDLAIEVETASLSPRPIEGIDPSLGLLEVTGEAAGGREMGPVDWRAAVAHGQLALGHELAGASRQMLDLARQHALDRIQFGRPIAKFQAIRHRLAETLVAIEAADAALDAAWRDHTAGSAAMAKAIAGRAARVAARHCQQVLAGIGFTTEHPLHRYVRRVLVLEQLFGGTHSLTRECGRDIIEHRRLPPLLPL